MVPPYPLVRVVIGEMLLPARARVTANHRIFRKIQSTAENTLNRADIGPALKEAIEITGKGAPYLVEIIAKEGYDFSRHQAHTS